MATSFADLLAEKTLAVWKQTIVATAGMLGLQTENWAEGGYTRTLVALFAELFKTAGDVVRILAASAFLDTAEGVWLKLLAKSVFNVDPIEATHAKAPLALVLTNGGGGLYVFDSRDIVVAHGSTHKTYRNTTGGTLNPGIGQTLTLDLEADEAGIDSNAGVGTITELVTTFTSVTCTNVVALVGLDEEAPAALRQRCRDSLASLAVGGIKKVYEFVAKSAKRPDGSPIGVTRVQVAPPPGDGTLNVYVASASGEVDGGDLDLIQDLFDAKATPYGFDVAALSATNRAITAPGSIYIPSSLGMSEDDARQAVFDALEAYVSALPIGGVVISPVPGRVYWSALVAVVASAIPGTLKVDLDSPVDIAVNEGEAPVWAGELTDIAVIPVGGA